MPRNLRVPQVSRRLTLDFTFNPELPKAKILDLATGRFLDTHTNLLLVGPAGDVKSHLAQAIGQRVCLTGHSALFTAHQMFASLRVARGNGRHDRKLARFTSLRLLIIDDLGLRPLTGNEPMDLYEIIRQRYERANLIVTSNKSFIDWGEIFGDHVLATAILDRLLHHASTLNIKGDSFRLKEKRRAGLLGRAPSAPAPTPQESHADNPIHGPLADLDSQPLNGHSH